MNTFEQPGGCVCGDARYLLTSEPVSTYACHCTECQTRTGSAFGLTMILAADALELTKGIMQVWTREVKNGQKYVWKRCPNCGTNLVSTIEGAPEILAIWPGTLDDAHWVQPKVHLWTRSAQSWIEFRESDIVYDEQPEDLAALFGL